MSTTMPKVAEITRKWYILDAADKPLGRTAAVAASILRGKHKPIFAPNCDCGDHVIIINAEKAVLTGKKLDQKMYRRHSGWIGRPQGGPVQQADEGAPRAGDDARRQGHGPRHGHWP